MLDLIKNRRSVRKYKKDNLPESVLKQIVEAGRYAPSGGNSQTNHFIVIRNESHLSHLKRLVREEFAKMEIDENTYKSIQNSVAQSKRGNYDFMYDAPVLIILANKIGYPNGIADCGAALENMMLAAKYFDVGSCWINQLHWLDHNSVIRQYLYTLGLGDNETVCGSLSLGYSNQQYSPPLERTGNKVTYVD